jgi:hypothetical protein
MGKEDAVSFLKDAFPVKLPSIEIIPTTKNEIKVIINLLHSKSHQIVTK